MRPTLLLLALLFSPLAFATAPAPTAVAPASSAAAPVYVALDTGLGRVLIELDPARYPRTMAYTRRILSRPSFAPWVEREAAFLARQTA